MGQPPRDNAGVAGTPLDVVAAVIRRGDDAVLLSLRRPEQHQGGLWEFPGGKQGQDESPLFALQRELDEELGIRINPACTRPLLQLLHHYSDKSVRLKVWEVFVWSGVPSGREGQEIAWVAPEALRQRAFPAANARIVSAALLPRLCLITPEPDPAHPADFLAGLAASLAAGIKLVQLRVKTRALADMPSLVRAAVECCHRHAASIVFNAPDGASALEMFGADGLHLPSVLLHRHTCRPIPSGYLLSAACHDSADIRRATRLGVDFGVLGPVLPTPSHPGAPGLGWDAAARLADAAEFPLFALGGQGPHSVDAALAAGFHGVAAITALWNRHQLPDARVRPGC